MIPQLDLSNLNSHPWYQHRGPFSSPFVPVDISNLWEGNNTGNPDQNFVNKELFKFLETGQFCVYNLTEVIQGKIKSTDSLKDYCSFFSELFNFIISKEEFESLFLEQKGSPNYLKNSLEKMGKNLFYAAKLLSFCEPLEPPQTMVKEILLFFLTFTQSERLVNNLIHKTPLIKPEIIEVFNLIESWMSQEEIQQFKFLPDMVASLLNFKLNNFTAEEMFNFYYTLLNYKEAANKSANSRFDDDTLSFYQSFSDEESPPQVESMDLDEPPSLTEANTKIDSESFYSTLERIGIDSLNEWANEYFSHHSKETFESEEIYQSLNDFRNEKMNEEEKIPLGGLKV